MVDYIRKHDLHIMVETLLGSVLAAEPENPIRFMIAELQAIDAAKNPQPTPTPAAPESPKKVRPKITLPIFGLDQAGKSTLVSAMSGDFNTEHKPTVGFTPSNFTSDVWDLTVFDLGGGRSIRGVWAHYFSDAHGIVFVVDSSTADRFPEAKQALKDVMSDERAKGKPLLIFANKQDIAQASSASEVERALGAEDYSPHHVFGCSAITETDSNIDNGIEWILGESTRMLEPLNARREVQMAEDKEDRKKKQEEQRKRVAAIKEERAAAEAAEAAAAAAAAQ